MKKLILAVIATSMLLTNAAFASTKTVQANSTQTKSVSTADLNNVYHIDTTDPH